MSERVFPQPNLGQGDQWAREIEKAIRDLGGKQQSHTQLLANLNRGSAATSMNSAKVYRSIETIESGAGSTTEFANDLANKITHIEASVASLQEAQTPPRALSVVANNVSVPAATVTTICTLTVDIPANANFALVMINGFYSVPSSATTKSVYGALVINGVTINDSVSPIRSGTGQLDDRMAWAAPVELLETQAQLTLSMILYSSQATTAASKISAMVLFQS